jgi:hypothetical protein
VFGPLENLVSERKLMQSLVISETLMLALKTLVMVKVKEVIKSSSSFEIITLASKALIGVEV